MADYIEIGKPEVLNKLDDSEGSLTYNGNPIGGGGSGLFLITATPTSQSGGTLDKTNKEIVEAYEAGKSIWVTAGGTYLPLSYIDYTSSEYPQIKFRVTNVDFYDQEGGHSGMTNQTSIVISSGDSETNEFNLYYQILASPTLYVKYTSSDMVTWESYMSYSEIASRLEQGYCIRAKIVANGETTFADLLRLTSSEVVFAFTQIAGGGSECMTVELTHTSEDVVSARSHNAT